MAAAVRAAPFAPVAVVFSAAEWRARALPNVTVCLLPSCPHSVALRERQFLEHVVSAVVESASDLRVYVVPNLALLQRNMSLFDLHPGLNDAATTWIRGRSACVPAILFERENRFEVNKKRPYTFRRVCQDASAFFGTRIGPPKTCTHWMQDALIDAKSSVRMGWRNMWIHAAQLAAREARAPTHA